ncbi:MAG: hypothetical protein LBS59_01695, partial [Puniceicoccales bacterium]|nr:hypothetical protein [Puniceicoccales bacterium]
LEKITDQTVLTDIAKNDGDDVVREAAVWRLTDQAVLADIDKNDSERYIREAASNKIKEV